ncbi:MAG: hypothetical protein A3H97_02555 [Acidobacteria bacterium RIFCSPLOWO2_02_FULL_65_29]|nr:MAG: hypothetical protein A3H97_02555 [Acidobacteria bacterium RIFCSPLOWO2_02_FULL_65_29]
MAKAKGSHAPSSVTLQYQLIRTTTSPDEAQTGVKSFVANLPAFEILKLNTKENLRAYIADYNPKKRNSVHDAIRDTILQEPERFITRNSGFVITASGIDVDDNKKAMKLKDPSIINGAQSQGEVRQIIDEQFANEGEWDLQNPPFFVRAEIIVDTDEDEVTETAIARNTATPVKSISQAGARGHLNELEKSIKQKLPGITIRKSETDVDVYDTRRILQYARLLMPIEVSGNTSAAERLRAYKNPEQCLTEFSDWFMKKDHDKAARLKYEFTVQIAPYAIKEYGFWESHDSWSGHHIWEETKKGGRACRRDDKNKIVWVSPGLLFPILGAMSEFVEQSSEGQWRIKKPKRFKPDEMIKRAVSQFRAHSSDPMAMGRSEAAYDALRIYPQTLVEVMREMEEEAAE